MEPFYVNFNQAKILKEKNFQVYCRNHYEYSLTTQTHEEDGNSGPFGWEQGECNIQSDGFINNSHYDFSNKSWFLCAAPEQWQVVEWLRVNYDIWIGGCGRVEGDYKCEVYDIKNGNKLIPTGFKSFDTPQEAISDAIDQVLKNLI